MKLRPLDLILLALVALAVGGFAYLAEANLDYNWRWHLMPQFLFKSTPEGGLAPNFLISGLLTTIRISVWATVFATVLGTAMALCRTSGVLFFQLLGGSYVELVRNLPPLVLVFVVYFFFTESVSQALGLDALARALPEGAQGVMAFVFAPPRQFSAFLAATVTIAVYEGAYITEHVRAGINSISRGQHEAAQALGLTAWQRMRHVILPQAVTRVIPPLAGQFISTIKDSSIVSVISISELTYQGMELMASTYLTFEIWITVALLYLCLTLTLSLLARRLETAMQRRARY